MVVVVVMVMQPDLSVALLLLIPSWCARRGWLQEAGGCRTPQGPGLPRQAGCQVLGLGLRCDRPGPPRQPKRHRVGGSPGDVGSRGLWWGKGVGGAQRLDTGQFSNLKSSCRGVSRLLIPWMGTVSVRLSWMCRVVVCRVYENKRERERERLRECDPGRPTCPRWLNTVR